MWYSVKKEKINSKEGNKMLEKILKRASWSDIIVSIIFIVFGVMLVTNPGTIISMLSVILGGIFVAIGAFKVIEYFSKGKEDARQGRPKIQGTL